MRKFEINMGTVESIARATDNLMVTSAAEKGIFEQYVNSLNRLSGFIEASENETAMNLLIQTATLLSEDAGNIMKEIISADASSVDIFLNYYNEYIAEGYVVDQLLNNAEHDNVNQEERIIDDTTGVLNEAYEMLKSCLTSEVETDDGCKGCCCM